MRFNPKARADSGQIDTRGPGGGGGGGFGGGGGGMRIPIPTGGRLGWGTVVVIILYVAIQMCSSGGLPGPDLGQGNTPSGQQTQLKPSRGGEQACTGEMANAEGYECDVELLTTSIQDYWARAFQEQAGRTYQDTRTVIFSGQTSSGCGAASSQMGPFYCPNDMGVFIDTSFMDQMLEGQLGAKGGTFALAYVLAHEYGHHVENLLGVLGKARSGSGPDSDGVRIELMADCLAGMWAKDATTTKDADGNVIIEELTQDDIARALDAARKVGDDYIQQRSGGAVNEQAWTHGSSDQRMKWFNVGLQEGSLQACDTWSADSL